MRDFNPEPTREEWRLLNEFGLHHQTWKQYKEFKAWEKRHYNHKAAMAFDTLLKSIGVYEFGFDRCHKCGYVRVVATANDGTFWICTYCGHLCRVRGNEYNYIIAPSEIVSPKSYSVDTRGFIMPSDDVPS